MIHATDILSRFAEKLTYEDLSPEVVETTKRYILDFYAACFAGWRLNREFNQALEELMEEMGGKEECDFLLSGKKLPVMNAAFLTAAYAHGADVDDGNRKAMGHVGAHVIAAVLTLAQTLEVSGKDILTAINVGYEVYNRVAAAAQPELVHRGFHSTGTAGAIACGAACAKLMGLDHEGIYNSMSLAAIQASGLIVIAESGQNCKPVNPANAARTGIFSAKMAAKGIQSSRYPLESRKGWFMAMCGTPDEKMITEGLGETFTICESYMKPYPSCRHTHCGIEAALDIRGRLPEGAKVRSIRVFIYQNAIQIAGQIIRPASADDSKFSIHYSLAVALSRGHYSLEDLDVSTKDPEVDDLIGKIELIRDDSMENREKGIRGARVVVETEDGSVFEKTVLIPKGDAANPFTMDDLKEKLADCARGVISPEEQDKLTAAVFTMDEMDSVNTINLYK